MRALKVTALVLAAVLILGGIGGWLTLRESREAVWVGQAGVGLADAGVSAHVNTCGERVDRVVVQEGPDVVAVYAARTPAEGVFTFLPDREPPAPWSRAEVTDGDRTTVPDSHVRVGVALSERPHKHRFRGALVAREDLASQPGMIWVGSPHKSGDHSLADPQAFTGECPGPVTGGGERR